MKKIVCTHPDHEEGKSCLDRGVGCHSECVCCIDLETVEFRKEEKRVLRRKIDLLVTEAIYVGLHNLSERDIFDESNLICNKIEKVIQEEHEKICKRCKDS